MPGYVCLCNDIIRLAKYPTNAISEVYSKFFATKTRYSGLLMMGRNDENIINTVNEVVSFIPRFFLLEKIKYLYMEWGIQQIWIGIRLDRDIILHFFII